MRENIDCTKIEELLELHYEQIENIVFQHGVKPSQMEYIMKEIVHSIIERIQHSPENSATQMELIGETLNAVNKSGDFVEETEELEDEQGKRIFHFEEDEALHFQISRLDGQERTALILYHFHQFGSSEIAGLLGVTGGEVQTLVDVSTLKLKEQLQVESEEQVEKLLSLLKKSYDRVKNFTNWETLIGTAHGKTTEAGTSSQVEKKHSDKFSIWKPVLLISVMLIFFGSIIFVGETYGEVDDRYFTKLEEDFEQQKERKIETLQIKHGVFNNLFYVQEADRYFDTMIRQFRKKVEKGEEVKRAEIKVEYEKSLDALALPSEMLEKVVKDPLTEDKRESELFFENYLMRLEELKQAFYNSLYELNVPNDQQSSNLDIPKEMAEALEKQNLKFLVFNEMHSYPVYLVNERTEKLKKSIHPDMQPHIMVLEKSDYMYSLNGEFDPEEILSTLSTFEKAIQTVEPYSDLYHRLSGVYHGIIVWSVRDSYITPEDQIFGNDGTVKPRYRELWTNFAKAGDDSPLSVLFKPIVSEMEETGWRFSQTQEYFDYQNVEQALSHAREGRLHEFSFAYSNYLMPVDMYTTEMYVDTESYQSTVKMLYNEFKNMMDPNYINGNDPLQILGVYELARAEGNVEAIYNLTYKTMPFDEFKEQWEPGPSLFEGVESIKMDPSLVENVPGERQKASAVFTVNGKEEVRVKLVQVNYYWLISEVMN